MLHKMKADHKIYTQVSMNMINTVIPVTEYGEKRNFEKGKEKVKVPLKKNEIW